MGKKLLVLLIAPSILFTWDHACAHETKEFIAESGDGSKQIQRSREGNNDSKGSREQQNKGLDQESQRQQPQMQQFRKQELQERNSSEIDRNRNQNQQRVIEQKKDLNDQNRDWNRNQNQQRVIEQKKDLNDQNRDWNRNQNQQRVIEQNKNLNDQKRGWESEKRDAVKNTDGYRDGDKDRTGYRRERISKEHLKEKEIRWQSKSKEWRKNFSHYQTRDHIFDDHFWNHFRRRNNNWYFDNNFQWFSVATWPRIVVWLPWAWSRPIYYYYEADGDVYYSTTEDFSYLIPVDSKELFIEQATRIANARYPISKQQSDWMPLGMFAFALDNDSSDMPKRYISLAISKEGAVSGAYFDAASNTMLEIQGGIDQESQRIAWKFVGNDWPIMESGLYNLTKDESTLLIHTSSRTTQTEVLIRLER